MAYQKIILTANNEYFAMRSGQHKTDVLRVNIKGTFANGEIGRASCRERV